MGPASSHTCLIRLGICLTNGRQLGRYDAGMQLSGAGGAGEPMKPRSSGARPLRHTASAGDAIAAMAALAVLVAIWIMLHGINTPWEDLARYTAYVGLGLTLPGTLVHKALRGGVGNWLGDLALGTALGFVLQLGAWMAASLMDVRDWLWLWPIVAFPLLAFSGTRRRILSRPGQPWPLLPLLGVITSAFFAFLLIFRNYARFYNPLPPSSVEFYPDMLWHMGLAAEARRAFPLQTPQVIGDGPLHYHWFSHAHVAASSLISGSDQTMIWLRLWWVPVVMTGVILTAEFARRLSGSAAAGLGAALLGSSVFAWPFWPDVVPNFGNISAQSPSQLFSIPVSLVAMIALVDLLRHQERSTWGVATVAVLGMVGSAGAKASTLPLIVGGIGVAFLASLILRRKRVLLFCLGFIASLIMLAGQIAVSGGSAGQGPMLGHALTRLSPYRVLVSPRVDYSLHVADGLWNTPGVGKILLPGLLLAMALAILRNLSLFLPLLHGAMRRDLAAWLTAGTCLASCLVLFILAHRGFSQVYFIYGAIPFGSALWAWSLSIMLRGNRARQIASAVTAVVVGAVTTWGYFAHRGHQAIEERAPMLEALQTFMWQALIIVAVLCLIQLAAVIWRREPAMAALLPVATVAILTPFVVGAIVPTVYQLTRPPGPPTLNVDRLDESRAGVWIAKHVPEYDVMATNIHCRAGKGLRCDSRKWWISGLGERRVLLEAWNYTPRGAAAGYYDKALYDLNDRAFTDPTPATLKELGAKGVKWLVADHQPGYDRPSTRLDELATRRYANETITIYELGR